jgi:hypothetical protein
VLALKGAQPGEMLAESEIDPSDVDEWIYNNLAEVILAGYENWDYEPT